MQGENGRWMDIPKVEQNWWNNPTHEQIAVPFRRGYQRMLSDCSMWGGPLEGVHLLSFLEGTIESIMVAPEPEIRAVRLSLSKRAHMIFELEKALPATTVWECVASLGDLIGKRPEPEPKTSDSTPPDSEGAQQPAGVGGEDSTLLQREPEELDPEERTAGDLIFNFPPKLWLLDVKTGTFALGQPYNGQWEMLVCAWMRGSLRRIPWEVIEEVMKRFVSSGVCCLGPAQLFYETYL
eukprot:TRINITY_DN29104_c0_g1_i1.p2 TRINITY_DN29104_c0_g1~~TRINITY_DN29104_c0_g1_i1.p2  ORF type:complete len:237 (-),score=7.10 TRINITY_DN29104_c0_g1_i1:1132-1842(-)